MPARRCSGCAPEPSAVTANEKSVHAGPPKCVLLRNPATQFRREVMFGTEQPRDLGRRRQPMANCNGVACESFTRLGFHQQPTVSRADLCDVTVVQDRNASAPKLAPPAYAARQKIGPAQQLRQSFKPARSGRLIEHGRHFAAKIQNADGDRGEQRATARDQSASTGQGRLRLQQDRGSGKSNDAGRRPTDEGCNPLDRTGCQNKPIGFDTFRATVTDGVDSET